MNDAKKSDAVGFFAALSGVCRGMEIFRRLIAQNVWRTVWHLFLLSALLSALVAAVQSWESKNRIREIAGQLSDSFGNITIAGGKITPAKSPQANRYVEIAPDVHLVYYSGKGELVMPRNPHLAFFWQPKGLLVGFHLPDGDWQIRSMAGTETVSREKLKSYLDGAGNAALLRVPSPGKGPVTYEAAALEQQIGTGFAVGMFAGQFFSCFFGALFYVTILGFFFKLFGRGMLNFGRGWVLAAYTGMPGMIIGSFFPALNLPLLDYNLVYVVALAIYLPMVSRRIYSEEYTESEGGK